MIKISLWKFPKLRTDEDFLRAALIELAKNAETPEDIFDASFEEVETESRQYVFGWGSSNINYTCAVGYKKEERYKQYNSITKKMETKTKEWIEWTPMSGSYSDTGNVYIKNDATKTFGDEIKSVRKLLENSKVTQYASEDGKKTVISDGNEQEINRGIASSVSSYCLQGLPGDKQKDFHYNYTSHIKGAKAYEIPVQVLKYNYCGEKYASYGFAVGNVEFGGEHPSDTETDKSRRDEKMKPFVLASLGACLVSSIVSLFSSIFIPSLLCFLAAAGIAAYSWVRWNTTLKGLRILSQKKKIVCLNDIFKKLGFNELSQEEKDMIEGGITK